ncbi:GFA family protein [Novosphingobium nitrogenifigens]|nr:GFA family protein [Novosphingobium nitrogenifigens]
MTESATFAEGGCACGAIRYRLDDAPYVVHCCHCTDCRREGGSAFAVNAVIEMDRFHVEGAQPLAARLPSASGAGQVVMRCPQCMTALWSHYGGVGDKAAFVRAGTLDDPARCPPSVHIWVQSKLPWILLDPEVPTFERFYSGRDIPAVYGESGAERFRILRGR